jgi:hypothetical protein
VSYDDYDSLALIPQEAESMLNQSAPNPLALVVGENSDGRQGDRGDAAGWGIDPHAAEQTMADDVGVELGHEGYQHLPIGAQMIDQVGLLWSSEGSSVDRPDGGTLARAVVVFETYQGHDVFRSKDFDLSWLGTLRRIEENSRPGLELSNSHRE